MSNWTRSFWLLAVLLVLERAGPAAWSAEPAGVGRTASADPEVLPDLTVAVPPGETPLADIGAYRVFWQSYGKPPQSMPVGWSGHFDAHSGISYQTWGRVLDRQALLMHSPWHVPPGKTWVEYRLALPAIRPIRLAFGIAMGPDVAVPGRSDGVTFSSTLTADGRQQELMRRHQDKAEWIDYAFDLSPYAGKTVVLQLAVEPGPKNNSSWDYSFFGDAKLTVGDVRPRPGELLRRLTASRAYQATAKASLAALSNRSGAGVTPSNRLKHANAIEPSGKAWRLTYQGDDCRIVYTYRPESGTLDDFMVQVDDGRPFRPAVGGQATAVFKQGAKAEELAVRGGKPVRIDRQGDSLNVLWEYSLHGKPLQVAWSFGIRGKALVVSARCDELAVSRFSLGEMGPVPLRRSIDVPYLPGRVAYLPAEHLFVCRYLDWTVSHSSHCPQGVATYEPKTDGSRNALVESGYVAVSPDLGEVLPNVPHPASPYLELLGPRIMLDVWGHHRGTYQGDAENLRALKDHGVDHLAIIQHVWQRWGYDVKLPDHLPANPEFGGDQGMIAFGREANRCGYVWSVHENYIDLYPDAPSYDPAARVLLADGSPSKAWFNAGTGVQSFGLKCNRALGYAKQNAPEIHRRFATTAGYLDVHTCVPPWHQLDHQADQPMAGMALAKVKFDTELFQFMRDTHGGPLFGEGANHVYWAGRCDGVEAQVHGGEDHSALVDFDLLKIHPQMVNHGMGYYERWFRRGYEHRLGRDTGTLEQIDKYRAQELAYGHAGFVGASQVDNLQWVLREHHLVHPVQRLYGTDKPVEISYEVGGQPVTAGVALAAGDTSRQRIRYGRGLTLWVNWRPEPWSPDVGQVSNLPSAVGQAASLPEKTAQPHVLAGWQPAPRARSVLPQWGFLAMGPQTQVFTALVDGKWADYAECPEYVFADARTYFHAPYLAARKDIEPRLRSFEYLGGDRARVTYEWIVNDTLDDDYHCFVHAVGKDAARPDGIEFQQDHALPKPTSQWRKGEVIVDGPHELRVSPRRDAYDLVIGLHKGGRVPLKGIEESGDRILIAQLKVTRDGDKITKVEALPPRRPPRDAMQADFTVRLNPPGTRIDFGPVATDGSVKVNREADRLVLFPYPRDKAFRVELDLKALAASADPSRVQVRALAAATQQDLGPVEFKVEAGRRLRLTVGKPGAGRYVVTWK